MSDIIDRANALADREREAALAAARQRIDTRATPRTDCADCGEPIGAGRLKALPLSQTCVVCAELSERRGRHFA